MRVRSKRCHMKREAVHGELVSLNPTKRLDLKARTEKYLETSDTNPVAELSCRCSRQGSCISSVSVSASSDAAAVSTLPAAKWNSSIINFILHSRTVKKAQAEM